MKIMLTTLAILASVLLGGSPANAETSSAVDACLANHPGAVTYDAVTSGNDLVCVDTDAVGSEGDDTYFWVGVDENPDTVLVAVNPAYDPGNDTLSLADWSHGFDESWGFYGVHYLGTVVENIDYTAHDDVVGDANACDNLSGSAGVTFNTGLGADLVQCVVGTINTQGGDDTIVGVTLNATANAGGGNDTVTGDAGADAINLGSGNDSAYVVGKGVDTVSGGTGTDVVTASSNDVVTSATVKTARLTVSATCVKHPKRCH